METNYLVLKYLSLMRCCCLCVVFGMGSCKSEPEIVKGVKQGTIAQLDTNQYTTITWKDTLIDFGKAREGDTVRMDFFFRNTGEKLLFINDVRSSCGCTIADYPKDPIVPGKGGKITAMFTTLRHPGEHRKLVMVKANTKGRTHHKLIFAGEVMPGNKSKQKSVAGSK